MHMIFLKSYISGIVFFICLLCIAPAFAADKKVDDKYVIHGEVDAKNSKFIKSSIEEINQKNDKLQAQIIALQDKLSANLKDSARLTITLTAKNPTQTANYGILQLTGEMQHIPIIEYDHPLLLDRDEKLPLFDGAVPLGHYEFKISGIVGQQVEKWPFVLPEGKWSIEKTIVIDLKQPAEVKSIDLSLLADQTTGIPQIVCANEVDCP